MAMTNLMTTDEPPRRARNPRGEGSRLRGDILDAAAALLREESEAAVTLRAVARQIGVSAPSIYRHFADRDAIMQELTETAFADFADLLRSAGGTDPAEHLHEVCSRYLRFAHEEPHRYRLMFGGVWDAAQALEGRTALEDQDRLRRLGLDTLQVLIDALHACAEVGASSSTDTARDATALWVALHGLADLRHTTPLFPWPERIETDLVTQLARLLRRNVKLRELAQNLVDRTTNE